MILCEHCGTKTKVLRGLKGDGYGERRRRECLNPNCKRQVETNEVSAAALNRRVLKRAAVVSQELFDPLQKRIESLAILVDALVAKFDISAVTLDKARKAGKK